MTKFFELRAKTYSYLIDDGSEDKKAKGRKRCIIKTLKFENCKNSLKATELDNKIKYLQKSKIKIDHEEIVRNNKSIFKTQQRFKSERHKVFTEEINKIVLNSNDNERIQSIDPIESYVYGQAKIY